jgi:hypothetical protein
VQAVRMACLRAMFKGVVTPEQIRYAPNRPVIASDEEYDRQYLERLATKCRPGDNGCIVVPDVFHNEDGYAIVHHRKHGQFAHRVVVILKKGPIPPDKMACHRCGNHGCVNDEHLYVGTMKAERGRYGCDGTTPGTAENALLSRPRVHGGEHSLDWPSKVQAKLQALRADPRTNQSRVAARSGGNAAGRRARISASESWLQKTASKEANRGGVMTRAKPQREHEKCKARMREMVAKLQEYVRTYSDQAHYEDYSDKTFLDDMLYGIGLSMQVGTPTDFTGAGGYERFKQKLREHLK